jgi:5-formyltetrahydrofolate cyclo-ligase
MENLYENISKAEARKIMRKVRGDIAPDTRTGLSLQICNSIAQMPEICAAQVVFLYAATSSEVALDALCHTLLESENATVAFPKCAKTPEGKPTLEWHAFKTLDDLSHLVPGAYNIMEPDSTAVPKVDLNALDPTQCAAVLPGLAFDLQGRRLGYGGGYYDRFLAAFEPFTIAAAFDESVVDDLKALGLIDAHDKSANAVATPTQLIHH